MSWSPSEARSLPSLRPGQFPPPATSRGKPTPLGDSRLHRSSTKAHISQLENTAESQKLPKPTSTGAQSSDYLQLTTFTKRKEAPTSEKLDSARPSKAPRLPERSLKDGSGPLSSSLGPSHAPFAAAPSNSQPFFSLTNQELNTLRRNMGKGASYKQFRDITVARELDRLGRGWDGYLRARDMAEEEGKTDEFWRHISLELNAVLSTTQFRPGAISIETAALVAQSNYTASIGRMRPEIAAEIRRMRVRSRSNLPDSGLAGPDSDSCDSTIVGLPSCSPPVPEADSQFCQRGSPDPVPVSRPRRVLKRPDYRIPPLFESSPEPPSSPDLPPRTPSPTPREIYNRTRPKFIQYSCEWNGCKASLKDLKTLKKHIHIVHAKEARDTLCCGWGSCVTNTPRAYESPEDLENHFEIFHLEPLKWSLGD
ncbi:hypothetical protein INS49_001816 [Diaporthe citri]|uniref:uncharacterized protein n=1 Tax=Diaporthe citri TaxID=83186 RepID=UPI001C81E5BD|nr:uncharacterized protein INS49_001816 [Diaporthe citri]KAG6367623.1 hypothetical protein INS49_001816 [Diaporthe citri]